MEGFPSGRQAQLRVAQSQVGRRRRGIRWRRHSNGIGSCGHETNAASDSHSENHGRLHFADVVRLSSLVSPLVGAVASEVLTELTLRGQPLGSPNAQALGLYRFCVCELDVVSEYGPALGRKDSLPRRP